MNPRSAIILSDRLSGSNTNSLKKGILKTHKKDIKLTELSKKYIFQEIEKSDKIKSSRLEQQKLAQQKLPDSSSFAN